MKSFSSALVLLLFIFYFFTSTSLAYEINSINNELKNIAEGLNASVTGERIKEFRSDITVNPDGSIDVKETINYFFDFERHGIYRNIPFTLYDDKTRYDMNFTFSPVVDPNGQKYKADIYKEGEEWVLKIGDPDKTITGDHTYIISYTIEGGIRYFETNDELYWNITGNGWNIPIVKAATSITLPSDVSEENVEIMCFTGSYGASLTNCIGSTDGSSATFETTKFLNSYEGLTIAYAFPKGIVDVLLPVEYVPFFERWYGQITLAGIILAAVWWYFILPVYLVIKWFRYGRDPYAGVATTASFDPAKVGNRFLTPAESGALLDEHVNKRDLFATIVDLARRGYIKISEHKKNEFSFIKTDPIKKDKLLDFEVILKNGIFDNTSRIELKKVKLYVTAQKVEEKIYRNLLVHKFFLKNPKTTRSLYYVLGGFAVFTFNFVLAFIAFVFGRHMPAKTLHGTQIAIRTQGLKNFLVSQERQLNYQGDKQMLFEKLLPYAVAFGVEKQWAKRFEKFDLKNPDWYEGTSTSHFNTALFASHLSKSYSSFQASSTPPSSSSSSGVGGGGFSGGGGGGGGGGSW